MKIINKLKTTKGMALGILVLFSLVLGLSYGTFIFSTGNYRSTSMLISNLLYGIDITTTGGNETINAKTVTLPSGKTSTILLKITSLNDVESKYGVSYKINSGTGSVKYSSNTGWLPTGKINKNGTGTYEKVVKIVIEATSDLSVDFNVDGGYTYNDLNSTKEGYTRVTEMYEGITDYTESLKTIIENETSNNIYGGDAINNYLQYPEDTDITKNIWRIIGYYESVDGIKIIANPVKETSTTNISTELTTFYNTLTKKSDYVLETNKFSCTGINCTTSTYSNIGLLSASEYSYIGGINSYLNDNNYYVIDNSSIKNITNGNITEASTTSNLRPVIYLQSDVKVKGSGTITNPYKLVENKDLTITKATLNGTTLDSFPTINDPYLPNTVTCTNGSVGYWDTERGSIRLTTVNLPTECTVDFKDGYTVTLEAINGTVTAPVSKTVGRSGIASFTVTPNTNYEATIESSTCTNGTLSGNTYTITGIKSNITCSITFKHTIYTWGKYNISTVTNYTETTSSGSGSILFAYGANYADGSCDGVEFYDIIVYSSYRRSGNKFYGSGSSKTLNCENVDCLPLFTGYAGWYYIDDNGSTSIVKLTSDMEEKHVGTGCNTNHRIDNADLITATASGTTKSKGDYVEDVTSENADAYPDNGISGSYWYVKK